MTDARRSFDLGIDPATGAPRALTPLDPARAKDLGAVFAAISPWADYPFDPASLAAYFAKVEPGAPRYQITLGGDVAGIAGLRNEWLRGPYVQFLGILPAFQGRGLGAAVMAWCERDARAKGARNLWVAASDFNVAARRFYERCGFAETARLDGLVQDGKTEILMRKRLA